jgi:hypothetical protein
MGYVVGGEERRVEGSRHVGMDVPPHLPHTAYHIPCEV